MQRNFINNFPNSIRNLTKSRRSRLTRILAIHKRQSLVLVTKPSAVVILTLRQVPPEHLGIKIGIHSHRRRRSRSRSRSRSRRIAVASHGQRLPTPNRSNSGETLRQGRICTSGKTVKLHRESHGREQSQRSLSSRKLRQMPPFFFLLHLSQFNHALSLSSSSSFYYYFFNFIKLKIIIFNIISFLFFFYFLSKTVQ